MPGGLSMTWDAVFFDLDDTLYSRAEAFARAVDRLAEVHVAPVTGEPASLIADRIIHMAYNRPPGSSNKKPPEFIAERIKVEHSAIPSSEQELALWFQDELTARIIPDEALEPIVSKLLKDHVPWAIITNGDDFQLRKIDALGLDIDTRFIIMSDVEGWAKPDQRIFKLALERVGIESPVRVLMVGDNPEADILGGLGAGMKTAWMKLGREWKHSDHRPDFELDSLGDLLKYL